jgi:hypothetical protein
MNSKTTLHRIAAGIMLSALALTGTTACNDEGAGAAPGVEEGVGEEVGDE